MNDADDECQQGWLKKPRPPLVWLPISTSREPPSAKRYEKHSDCNQLQYQMNSGSIVYEKMKWDQRSTRPDKLE